MKGVIPVASAAGVTLGQRPVAKSSILLALAMAALGFGGRADDVAVAVLIGLLPVSMPITRSSSEFAPDGTTAKTRQRYPYSLHIRS
jgi:hypothetical protein